MSTPRDGAHPRRRPGSSPRRATTARRSATWPRRWACRRARSTRTSTRSRTCSTRRCARAPTPSTRRSTRSPSDAAGDREDPARAARPPARRRRAARRRDRVHARVALPRGRAARGDPRRAPPLRGALPRALPRGPRARRAAHRPRRRDRRAAHALGARTGPTRGSSPAATRTSSPTASTRCSSTACAATRRPQPDDDRSVEPDCDHVNASVSNWPRIPGSEILELGRVFRVRFTKGGVRCARQALPTFGLLAGARCGV